LNSSDRVLQIGGGTGVFTLSLVQHSDEVHFTDLITYDDFAVVQDLLEKIEFTSDIYYSSTDAAHLSYKENSFDKVFAMDVLEHVPQEEKAIREISRVLKPNGKLIVSAPIEVGVPLLIRETYRQISEYTDDIDEKRRNTESINELIRGVVKRPSISDPASHRGYDYRQTRKYMRSEFESVSTNFCPVNSLKTLNLTAIITAENPRRL